MNKQLIAAKDFVVTHKTAIMVTTTVTSVTLMVIMRTGLAQHDAFLREHNLYNSFYDQID